VAGERCSPRVPIRRNHHAPGGALVAHLPFLVGAPLGYYKGYYGLGGELRLPLLDRLLMLQLGFNAGSGLFLDQGLNIFPLDATLSFSVDIVCAYSSLFVLPVLGYPLACWEVPVVVVAGATFGLAEGGAGLPYIGIAWRPGIELRLRLAAPGVTSSQGSVPQGIIQVLFPILR
jgi:hypothetical protein